MKFAGHTMGTPELNLYGAMKLFHRIGFDGIEVRCAKDGQIDTTTADRESLTLAKKWSREFSLEFTCLTSYFKDFVTEKREDEIRSLKRVIDIAAELDCPNVRVYGGLDPIPEGYTIDQDRERTASGIRLLGEYAKPKGVRICIETHGGTLTLTAADTVEMVERVNLDNVGILFDYAWIHWAGKESVQEAVDLCAPYIFHCHYKEWRIGPDGKRTGALMGQGSIPWPEVMRALAAKGYDGTWADEYEKYWRSEELPEPQEGMAANLAYMRGLV